MKQMKEKQMKEKQMKEQGNEKHSLSVVV